LLERLEAVRAGGLSMDVLVVDDDSQDGTEAVLAAMDRDWVRLITRHEDRGLSAAVVRGVREATGAWCVVMDADLSHPPEVIPEFLTALQGGADFVVGSRYVPGGSTEDGWGFLRWVNSMVATVMARPFTSVRDPMSGFLGFSRTLISDEGVLDPVGYKIGLELIVKGGCRRVEEVPIHFSTRQHGQSKLSLRVQLQYLNHIIRLARWKYPRLSSFLPFAMVGVTGIGVYVLLLWFLERVAQGVIAGDLQIVIAIVGAMVWNFAFDRWLAFWYARRQPIVQQLLGFLAVCSLPVLVNFLITRWLVGDNVVSPAAGAIGAAAGSIVGVVFNWLVVRSIVFRRDDSGKA